MKLQLEHLAPYLPYGLTFRHYDANRERESICTYASITTEEITLINSDYEYDELIEDAMPLLVPLSEINSLFEQFVDLMPFGDEYKSHLFFEEKPLTKLTDLFIIKSNVSVELSFNKAQPLTAPYLAVNLLFKNHFDVFNLIPEGLALNKLNYIV